MATAFVLHRAPQLPVIPSLHPLTSPLPSRPNRPRLHITNTPIKTRLSRASGTPPTRPAGHLYRRLLQALAGHLHRRLLQAAERGRRAKSFRIRTVSAGQVSGSRSRHRTIQTNRTLTTSNDPSLPLPIATNRTLTTSNDPILAFLLPGKRCHFSPFYDRKNATIRPQQRNRRMSDSIRPLKSKSKTSSGFRKPCGRCWNVSAKIRIERGC